MLAAGLCLLALLPTGDAQKFSPDGARSQHAAFRSAIGEADHLVYHPDGSLGDPGNLASTNF